MYQPPHCIVAFLPDPVRLSWVQLTSDIVSVLSWDNGDTIWSIGTLLLGPCHDQVILFKSWGSFQPLPPMPSGEKNLVNWSSQVPDGLLINSRGNLRVSLMHSSTVVLITIWNEEQHVVAVPHSKQLLRPQLNCVSASGLYCSGVLYWVTPLQIVSVDSGRASDVEDILGDE